jgi:hypothetical protein
VSNVLGDASEELKTAPEGERLYVTQYAISRLELGGAHVEIIHHADLDAYMLRVEAVGRDKSCLTHPLMVLRYITEKLDRDWEEFEDVVPTS